MYPEAEDSIATTLEDNENAKLNQELQHLGFTIAQARQAITGLSTPSQLASTLLASLGPLQACIEYLILHIPECDLPQRFLPAINSSNPFISSAHAGTEDLKTRWLRDKAVKECGWPEHVVNDCVSDRRLVEDWPALVKALNDRLVGGSEEPMSSNDASQPECVDTEELESFEANFSQGDHLELPLLVAPFKLHILLGPERSIAAQGSAPPMYLTSQTVAAYIRLHLLSGLILAFRDGTLVEPGESIIMAIVRFLEERWASIEDDGPPTISHVLRHMLPTRPVPSAGQQKEDASVPPAKGGRKRRTGTAKDDRLDARVKEEFVSMRASNAYKKLLESREKLPAFSVKEQFLAMLDNNRCVIVVGETGSVNVSFIDRM